MHVSVTVNWCAHTAPRKRTHGAKRSINLLQKDTKYIFRLVVVLWSVDLLSDRWSKSKILSTGVGYEGIFYSPQKRISQLSDYREWENIEYWHLYCNYPSHVIFYYTNTSSLPRFSLTVSSFITYRSNKHHLFTLVYHYLVSSMAFACIFSIVSS